MRERLAGLIDALSAGLIERGTAVRLSLLAALAGEHLLLIGPPGTAKSEVARRLHRAFADGRYFERLLTRFSVPEELFGPLSISALEDDRYERRVEGYLPTATIAFIDEVFKANSAILNALLTLLNEREFDNGATRIACPLVSVIGATNEVPEDEVTAAFFDRFLLRLPVAGVSGEGFPALLDGLDTEVAALPAGARLCQDDLAALRAQAVAVRLPAAVSTMLIELRGYLQGRGIYVSDRRWRKIVHLLRVAAASDGRDAVSVWDGWLLQFCVAQRADQVAEVAAWYARRLGVFELLDPQRFRRVVEGFEAQLEQEQNATDLNYGADGKLSMFDGLVDGKRGEDALRMPAFTRRRHFGRAHVEARVGQVRALMDEVDIYLARLDGMLAELEVTVAGHLWVEPGFAVQARLQLADSRSVVVDLRQRLHGLAQGFEALPRLAPEQDRDARPPEPMLAA